MARQRSVSANGSGQGYYAALLKTRDRLGVRTRSGRVHHEVIGIPKKRDSFAGNQLDKLEQLRSLADYSLRITDEAEPDWRTHWELARNYSAAILRRVNRLT